MATRLLTILSGEGSVNAVDAARAHLAPAGGTTGRELAEGRLRRAITRGDMAPGQRLVEAELAELHGVTRNGVRLAIDTLIGEGLVERIPNRGARVRAVSQAEAIEITECRMVLEGLIARKAAERITAAEVLRLRGHASSMRQAVAGGELLAYSTLIADLHELLRDVARQPTATALIERLQAQIVRHQFQLSLRPGRPQRSLAELEELIQAVADRDPDRAEEAARAHLQNVIAALGAADS
jgi:DNA-binding GntR family transcriptional regulator